jgi:hypothetical protein
MRRPAVVVDVLDIEGGGGSVGQGIGIGVLHDSVRGGDTE